MVSICSGIDSFFFSLFRLRGGGGGGGAKQKGISVAFPANVVRFGLVWNYFMIVIARVAKLWQTKPHRLSFCGWLILIDFVGNPSDKSIQFMDRIQMNEDGLYSLEDVRYKM